MHNVSQRHLGKPLGEAEGLLEAVSFKKATESMGRGRVAIDWRIDLVTSTLMLTFDLLNCKRS